MKRSDIYGRVGIFLLILLLVACNSTSDPGSYQGESNGKIKVVATTSIVADVVDQVGADQIELSILVPRGSDPHSFEPTPQDIAKVDEADVVFAVGVGLEEFLENLIESAGAKERVVYVSDGIEFIQTGDDHQREGEDGEGAHSHNGADPHTWTAPNNVIIWVQNIQEKLSEVDASNADLYQSNAEKYQAELEEVDAWIRQQVQQIPPAQRLIVTDHQLFGYFAQEYGFEQVGAIFPGYSTMAQPSAKELAELEDTIRQLGVKAVLVGNTVNPDLAQRVVEDTGTNLVFIYTGSLSDPGGEADSYLDYLHYNVNAILEALR